MDFYTKTLTIVSMILALSIASERLVDIIKGWNSFLNTKSLDPKRENMRKTCTHILSLVSGCLTVFLAWGFLPGEFTEGLAVPQQLMAGFALGLLASGGSSFWNSILTYMLGVKEMKKLEVTSMRATTESQSENDAHAQPRDWVDKEVE
ncbi:MAG: hypothetical protein AAB870_00225 [Patescibacteria group bacterium]